MNVHDEMNKINQEKAKIMEQEALLRMKRKQEIARLAEHYGILSLPDEEIRLAFEKLAYNHNHR